MSESHILKTVDRSLHILTLFESEQPSWGVSELARRLQLPKSVVQKTLATFARRGFLYQEEISRRYRLGPRILSLARAAEPELARIAKPLMLKLAETTDETVKLTVVDGAETVIVAAVESSQSLRMTGRVGERNVLHRGASNKLLAAYIHPDEVRSAVRLAFEAKGRLDEAEAFIRALLRELQAVREAGYAVSTGEIEAGVKAIAVPLIGHQGRSIACLSVVGPAARMTGGKQQQFLAALRRTSDLISEAVGWTVGRREGRDGMVAAHASSDTW